MLIPVFLGFDEYNCTDGTNSLILFTLKAPACSACFPLTIEIGIGTFCALSFLLLEEITTSTNSFSSLSWMFNVDVCPLTATSSVLNPTYCTKSVNEVFSFASIENSPLLSALVLYLVPLIKTLAPGKA